MAEQTPVQLSDQKQSTDLLTQSLSEHEIRKQLLIDILQDKSSLVPMSLSIMALLYSLLYAPVLGGFFIGLGISIVTASVGIAAFIWRFVIRFQQNYALKSEELVTLFEVQNRYFEEHNLMETHAFLEKGFYEIKAAEGLNTLHSMNHEYEALKPVLRSGKEIDLLSISNLEAMVKATYFRGLSLLEDVFELERAISSTDHTKLQLEITELQRRVAADAGDSDGRDRLDQVKERIVSNQERLQMVRELKQRVDELLYQAKRCEASLGKTRIELAVLKADASEIGVSEVIEALRKTIDRAKEVQEELKQIGF